MPPFSSERLDQVLKLRVTGNQYTECLKSAVREHVRPGQLALVIVKKTLLDLEDVPKTGLPRADELKALPKRRHLRVSRGRAASRRRI